MVGQGPISAVKPPAATTHEGRSDQFSFLIAQRNKTSIGAGLNAQHPIARHTAAGASRLLSVPVFPASGPRSIGVQARQIVNAPGDRFEREADTVAAKVMQQSRVTAIGDAPGNLVQRLGGRSGSVAGNAPAAVQSTLSSPGRPLDNAVRQFMEPRFGAGFERVRVHADRAAATSARQIGAQAYTAGQHIVFGEGAYRPESTAGRELIAHELTHVIQQTGVSGSGGAGGVRVQRRNIFQEIGGLFTGDTFESAALNDYLQFLRDEDRIEDFTDSDNKARAIVTQWKTGASAFTLTARLKSLLIQEMMSGFTGNDDENAILELLWRATNAELGTIFSEVSAERLNAVVHGSQWNELQQFYSVRFKGGMSEVLAGRIVPQGQPMRFGDEVVDLREPNSAEREQVREAINTETRTSTGAAPQFQQNISGEDPWEIRIRDKLNERIDSMHQRMVVNRPARISANMLDDTDINRVAAEAKRQTDVLYGAYYTKKPEFVVNVNIHDAFDTRDAYINSSQINADKSANFRVLKLLNGNSQIKAINNQHGAIYTRAEEWALIAPLLGFPLQPVLTEELNKTHPPHVTSGLVHTRRAELLDIHRNWNAYAGGGQIYLDRMEAPDDRGNRNKMYKLFRTVMHEYVHTLEHPDHERYRKSLPAQQGGFVLREGVTEYLSDKVWRQVNFTPQLRTLIEGGYQNPLDPNGHDFSWITDTYGYEERENAQRMADVVGPHNVAAAFFLGRVELIGGATG